MSKIKTLSSEDEYEIRMEYQTKMNGDTATAVQPYGYWYYPLYSASGESDFVADILIDYERDLAEVLEKRPYQMKLFSAFLLRLGFNVMHDDSVRSRRLIDKSIIEALRLANRYPKQKRHNKSNMITKDIPF